MPHLLTPAVQHYAWGGYEFLPTLLGRPASSEPTAEIWMGDHPKGPSLLSGSTTTLQELITSDPKKFLGLEVCERFGTRLPFLLKVLDVRQMLSIQVHPDKGTAEAGFAREEAHGPERTAPNRNYRDDNHKPELAVAISDFYLLHGFKDAASIRQSLTTIPGWDSLLSVYEAEGLAGLYEYVMRGDQAATDRLLQPLASQLSGNIFDRSEPEFWAQRAFKQYSKDGHHDRGIFSIFWFNLVHLSPGEAIFQDAGIPHAYLEGQCIELMAGSDNVLRGGLTPKHIDVDELLLNVRFESVAPQILSIKKTSSYKPDAYSTPAPDFRLSVAETDSFGGATTITAEHGPLILLLWEGRVTLRNTGIELGKDQRVVFLAAGEAVELFSKGQSIVYIAGLNE